jgi:diguanylate cyclase (GGDEF)-like protein
MNTACELESTPNIADSVIWRVLLVDDEPTQRLITARMLRRAGFEVETAGNGQEALKKIESGHFQLLVTDWEMPEMDGIALCRAVRTAGMQGYVYTILLTSRDAIEHLVAGLGAGADDYLTKPVLEPELLARLSTGKRIVTLERSLRTANEENRRLSVTDPLTGTYNRRHLMDQLPKEIDRAARYARHLSVVMCDVDHFKRINDTYGHQAGDDVLRLFVQVVQKAIRSSDWVGRYGGEEFMIVLPETNMSCALTAAEHMRSEIAAHALMAGDVQILVTASFGVAGWEGPVPVNSSLDALMANCDEGVYASKEAGRNRVTGRPMD